MSKRGLRFVDYLYLTMVKGLNDREAVAQASALRGLWIWLRSLRVRVKLEISIRPRWPGDGG